MDLITTRLTLMGDPIPYEGSKPSKAASFILRPYISGLGVTVLFQAAATVITSQPLIMGTGSLAIALCLSQGLQRRSIRKEDEYRKKKMGDEGDLTLRYIETKPTEKECKKGNNPHWIKEAKAMVADHKIQTSVAGAFTVTAGALCAVTSSVPDAISLMTCLLPGLVNAVAGVYRWNKVQQNKWIIKSAQPEKAKEHIKIGAPVPVPYSL